MATLKKENLTLLWLKIYCHAKESVKLKTGAMANIASLPSAVALKTRCRKAESWRK